MMKEEFKDLALKGNSEADVITVYTYKVRRQAKFLDNNTVLKRATTYSSHEPLNIGGLYILHIGKNKGFYRVESLLRVAEYD